MFVLKKTKTEPFSKYIFVTSDIGQGEEVKNGSTEAIEKKIIMFFSTFCSLQRCVLKVDFNITVT